MTFETRGEEDDETTILAEHDSRFTARVDPASSVRVGEPLELTLDPSKFHFFDVRSGASLLADAGREPAHEEALPG